MVDATRRTIVATLAGLTVGGASVASLSGDSTAATVQQTGLEIADRRHSTADGDITDVRASVDGKIGIEAESTPDAYKLSLVGGPIDASPAVLTYTGGSFDSPTDTVERSLSASLLRHDGLSVAMFNPQKGETVEHDLQIGLVLDVRNDNRTIATDEAFGPATVRVEAPAKMSVETSLSGSGEVSLTVE